MERQVEEAEQLEGVGQSPCHPLPTWQLVQMAVEAGPSKSGRAGTCLQEASTNQWEAKSPEGILAGRQGKEVQEVLAWDSCPILRYGSSKRAQSS